MARINTQLLLKKKCKKAVQKKKKKKDATCGYENQKICTVC